MMADTDETTTLPVKDSDDMISQEGTSDQVIGDEQEGKSKPKPKAKQKAARASEAPPRRTGKRGRKPSRIDTKARLERSRQSARECRARKKLRYQYVEELVTSRERAIQALRTELHQLKQHCTDMDKGEIPQEVRKMADQHSDGHNSNG